MGLQRSGSWQSLRCRSGLKETRDVPLFHAAVDPSKFNTNTVLPFELRLKDFEIAMQDVYDFFSDVNSFLVGKGLQRLDDMLRKQNMSGLISDMLTASLAKHSRTLTENRYHNGHPDLIVKGKYPNDKVRAGADGVEIKTTLKKGGAVDTHGARNQWMCVFVYSVDRTTEPASQRQPTVFSEIYLSQVAVEDFRKNQRSELGTRTATLGRAGLVKFRQNWVYKL
jgi:hypothetical protein